MPSWPQGQTSDTAHVIIIERATRQGSYVAITRARRRTDIYNASGDISPNTDQLAALTERVSRTPPDLPSISNPLPTRPTLRPASPSIPLRRIRTSKG